MRTRRRHDRHALPPGVVLALAAAAALAPAPAAAAGDAHAARLPSPPFGVGERLVFAINYGAVNAGEGVLEITRMEEFQGHRCYRIESTASSNRFFSGFYRVRDKVVSYIDEDELFSRYFMKRLREGSYRKTVEIEFDHVAGVARYQDGREFETVPGVHDVLSAFYFVRTLDLEVGTDVFLSAHSSRETYELRVIVHSREQVSIELGTFDCFLIQPVMLGEGIFKHEGDLMIYLTADERRMPVLVKSQLPVGSVSVELREFTLAPPRGADRE
jgi:hypothetical protein